MQFGILIKGRYAKMKREIKQILRKICRKKSADEANLEYLLSHGMKLGQNSYINSGCMIDTEWPWLISIGDNVIIASDVTILAHDASTNVIACGTKLGKVSIGNNVFIGTKTVILCNVEIGDNVVVGAGSVVTHSLPSEGVYAGNPARQICTIEEYRRKYEALRKERPNFDRIKKWDQWSNSTENERKIMIERMKDGIGFV